MDERHVTICLQDSNFPVLVGDGGDITMHTRSGLPELVEGTFKRATNVLVDAMAESNREITNAYFIVRHQSKTIADYMRIDAFSIERKMDGRETIKAKFRYCPPPPALFDLLYEDTGCTDTPINFV